MKCAIICGGMGTRLGQHAGALPKVLAPFGGRPLLDHLIDAAAAAGIDHFLLLTRHLSQMIEDHVEFCSTPNVRLEVVRESTPLGTAGAVKSIERKLSGEDLLVLYGDVMVSMDIRRMVEFHLRTRAWATLAVHPNDHPHDSDLLSMDPIGRIDAFYPKPRPANRYLPNLVNAGVYVLSPALIERLPEGYCDFGRHVFPLFVSSARLYGYKTAEYLKDMGSPERYDHVRGDFNSGVVASKHRRNARAAVFLDRDGVINPEVGGVRTADQFELLPRAAEAVRRINESGRLAVLITNQPVVAKGWTTPSELARIHHKMETLLGRDGAYLDEIYFCPHHPDRGFPGEVVELKIPCQCRKPAPEMLYAAARDLNIDLASSVFIGDSERDFACARAAGVRPVGIGDLGQPVKTPPDLRFDDLYSAVNTLLEFSATVRANPADHYLQAPKQRPKTAITEPLRVSGQPSLTHTNQEVIK